MSIIHAKNNETPRKKIKLIPRTRSALSERKHFIILLKVPNGVCIKSGLPDLSHKKTVNAVITNCRNKKLPQYKNLNGDNISAIKTICAKADTKKYIKPVRNFDGFSMDVIK